jgi:glutaredoxin
MKVQLLVSEWCTPCHEAERIWREVAEERDIEFEVLDMAQPEARAVAQKLRIRTIPSVVVNGVLKGIGVQSKERALELVAGAPERPRRAARFVGLTLAMSSRCTLHAAAAYLVLAGAALVAPGGLLTDGPGRAAVIHVFAFGFVTFMIFGLGEHMLPRFLNRPIRLGAWTWGQQALAHAGLIGMAVGYLAGLHALTLTGAILMWSALAVYAGRIVPVLWSPEVDNTQSAGVAASDDKGTVQQTPG